MGTGHCGSTLLDLILGSHSDTFSLGEFHTLYKTFGKSDNDIKQLCGVCENECGFWDEKASVPLLKLYFSRKTKFHSLAGKIARYLYNPYNFVFKWSKKSIIIDSSKRPEWFRKQFSHKYTAKDLDQYLIYLCRDGRAVINSYLRKYPEKGVEHLTETWKKQTMSMNKYYDEFPESRRMKIHYEELASNPEEVTREICDFIDMQYEESMLRYWEHEHHHLFGNAGTNRMIIKYREQQSAFQGNNKDWLEKHGGYYDNSYYENQGLSIKLDQRWKKEFSPENAEIFNSIAGDINRPFILNI